VRDVLYVDDLLELYDIAIERRAEVGGRVYNIGGGPELTVSLLEFLDHVREGEGLAVDVAFGEWRPGDQRVYVSDVERAREELGWTPSTSVADGTRRLRVWLETNRG
jgi:CDP-paratose 2-epimerase